MHTRFIVKKYSEFLLFIINKYLIPIPISELKLEQLPVSAIPLSSRENGFTSKE